MKNFVLIFAFLLGNLVNGAPVATGSQTNLECPEEKIEKIGECVNNLVSTVEKITKWVDQEYKFNDREKKEFRTKCQDTKNCFDSVISSCPDFPTAVTNELDVMCSRFNFIIDKFTECVPKLDNLKCVNEVFGPKSLKKTTNEKCKDLREHKTCSIEEVGKACGEKFREIFEENFNLELKMHKC